MKKTVLPMWLRHFDLPGLLIAATRYYTGRMTISAASFAQYELARAWPEIPEHTRAIIRRDLEGAFRDDDRDRACGSKSKRLGMDCDRDAWQAVRCAWAGEPPTPGPVLDGLHPDEWVRLRDWMADPNRRPANTAFTAGTARDAATAFEAAMGVRH